MSRKSGAKFVCEDCGQRYFSQASLDDLHSEQCEFCGGKLIEA